MKQVAFFVEGEEDRTNRVEAMQLRRVFHQVFRELDEIAQSRGLKLQFRLYGSRRSTYEKFCEAVAGNPDIYPILLVDSEDPVAAAGKCWEHLAARPADQWARPASADDEQCQLMVHAIEAWLFADPAALQGFFGQGFRASALPRTQNVEQIPKTDHVRRLEAATKDTQKGRYHKVRHLAPLLARLNMAEVRRRAWHCNRIFDTLGTKIRSL